MKIISWNICGCNHPRKIKVLEKKLKMENPIVLFLQDWKSKKKGICGSVTMFYMQQRIWEHEPPSGWMPIYLSSLGSGVTIFRLSERIRGHPNQLIKNLNLESFLNAILKMLWSMFRGIILWVIWKERNNRIFQDMKSIEEEVWKRLTCNI